MQDYEIKDRLQGAILGALIGDALGVGPHWYYDLDKLRAEFGEWIDDYTEPRPGRYHEGLKAGDWSQSGQVYVMLLESLAERGAYFENDFTSRVDELLETLDGTPSSGRYTDEAMRDVWHDRVEDGLSWEEAGSFADTGEAAFRTVALAARYAGDFAMAAKHMLSNVLVTHVDPFVAGRSLAYGMHVRALINGASLADSKEMVQTAARDAGVSMSVPVAGPMRRAAAGAGDEGSEEASFFDAILLPAWIHESAYDPAVQIEPAYAVCRLYGLACPINSLLPAAYYLTSRFEGDFEFAALHAVNGGGNNMARAALTGGLAGAQCGLSEIPERFIHGLADSDEILEMAEKIADDALAAESGDEEDDEEMPPPEHGW
jgi:ADP-ribosylglycohydrolase